jgi:hypothetical protein
MLAKAFISTLEAAMDILQKLADLGFAAESVNKDRKGLETFRISTSQGFTYERFESEAAVEVWAKNHRPEEK